ncbi:Gfo/Idh/MocA family protein [Fimbriiglobus ruber]|uniref:Putative oxidoreductase n=1 Tax=Fimbriiglobus ruber TaxID=1908690 RepID=A0A225DPF5_9BACT|nr:Gfo/Idh/MocA family oxidoreductase [Fimbriiglobus ruber]OWK42953.1 putative oxidoreductase [Fimbriiglobus ruber]
MSPSKSSTAPITFALIGAGGIAQSYAQAFDGHPDAQLTAVADVRLGAAQAMAERFKCPAFEGYKALLADGPAVDAVLICTPPDTHEEITTAFARRGVHVLCEKPFTITPASAKRMVIEARQAGVLLTMASKFRYVEDVIKAKSIVASGVLGEIVLFENAFTSRVDMSTRWNADPKVSGGGVLIDNGTHSVDLMRYFLGPLAEVHCVEGKRVQGLEVEDTVRVFVHSAAGVMGSVDLSWSLNKELDWFLNIYGSQGTLQVGWKQSKYRQAGRDWVVFGKGYDKTQAFRSQIGNFARAIQGTEPLLISWEDAIASVDAIAAAYQSLRESPWTGVKSRSPADMTRTPAPAGVGIDAQALGRVLDAGR